MAYGSFPIDFEQKHWSLPLPKTKKQKKQQVYHKKINLLPQKGKEQSESLPFSSFFHKLAGFISGRVSFYLWFIAPSMSFWITFFGLGDLAFDP